MDSSQHCMRLGLILGAAILLAGSGCSIQKIAANTLADTLSGSGSVFASDDDPELIRDAAPFSLKLMESVLAQTPNHRGLLTAISGGFTQYAYGFIVLDADMVETHDIAVASAMRDRARRLLMRARDYGLRGLDVAHPGFSRQLRRSPAGAVKVATKADVPLLYWTAVAWGAAITISKNDPDMVLDQVVFEALLDRALALDETFDYGAIHSILISYEPSRQGATTPAEDRSRAQFKRTVELSSGYLAAPYVSLAEAISIPKQDRAEFESLLNKALAIDVNARPQWRLVNVLMQQRARWLLSRSSELFVE